MSQAQATEYTWLNSSNVGHLPESISYLPTMYSLSTNFTKDDTNICQKALKNSTQFYSKNFLNKYLKKLFIAESIYPINSSLFIAGLAFSDEKFIFISCDFDYLYKINIRSAFHHELSSLVLLDDVTSPYFLKLKEDWVSVNKRPYICGEQNKCSEYDSTLDNKYFKANTYYSEAFKSGFFNYFSMFSFEEDFNTVAQIVFVSHKKNRYINNSTLNKIDQNHQLCYKISLFKQYYRDLGFSGQFPIEKYNLCN